MAEFNIYEGMMSKIQALISPLDVASGKEKGGTDLHPFFKKRGKRHNRDYCDSCGEKGNVLCCEICPASFHLLCHDPPLTESDIPHGQFSCRACKQTGKAKDYVKNKGNDIQNSEEQFPDFRIVISSKLDKTPNGLHHGMNKVTSTNESDSENNSDTGIRHETSDKINTLTNETISENSLCSKSHNCSNDRKRNQLKNIKKIEKCSDIESDDSVAVENMWQIIGVNKKTKITDCNENEQNSQKENVAGSRKRRIKETEKSSPEKKFQNRDFNIKLPYCDYLLKQMNIPQEGKDSCVKINISDEVKSIKENMSTEKKDNTDSFGLRKTFKHIINEVKKTNPKQFTLPPDYTENIDLSLITSEKDPESFPNDLDYNDLLKLPTRKCYYCRGTCLIGQMISCDFCPAHFHLNCLTPPLCSIPEDKWMCPLHPHHILDSVMKNPSSLTELMSWSVELNTSFHAEEVQSKFMKRIKALKKKRSCRIKKHDFTEIPDLVKYHYKHPMPQIPTFQETNNQSSDCLFENDFILVPHHLIAKSNRCCDEMKLASENYNTKERNRCDDSNDSVYYQNTLIEISDDNCTTDIQKDLTNNESKFRQEDLSTWDEKNKEFKFKSCGIYNYDELKVYEKSPLYNRHKSMKNSHILNSFQSQDYSRAQIGSNSNIESNSNFEEIKSSIQRGEIIPSWKTIESIILRDIDYNFISDTSDDFVSAKLESNLKGLLAKEIINRTARDLPPSFRPDSLPYPFFLPSLNNNTDLPVKPKTKVRAVLCPLSHRAPLIYMNNHTLSIGCDFSNDVCLLNYGHCNFVSGEHAIIYYDSLTNAYELLNYSEYSTVVDGVIYTCNISSNPVDKEDDSKVIDEVKTEEKDSVDEAKVDKVVPVKEERLEDSNENASSIMAKGKKTSSIAGAAETRSTYKKLLHDIDRLVTKSQEEMASIAEEDLAEIARAIKAPSSLIARLEESPSEKHKSKRKDSSTPVKRNKEKKNTKENESDSPRIRSTSSSKVNDDLSFDSVSDCKIIETTSESDKIKQKSQVKAKEVAKVCEDNVDTVAVRRSQRRIKRSIFSTYRREMRGKKSKNILDDMDEESSEKESEKEEMKKTTPATNGEEGSSEEHLSENDHLSSDDFCMPEGREKCLCQVNNVKFPNGRDETWEKAAPLYHGSYVRFGCIEFVFSIVGYPAPPEDRPYREKKQPNKETLLMTTTCKSGTSELKKINENNEDLSSKLNSILNVLSSRSDKDSAQFSDSNSPSSFSSRSSSPSFSVAKEEPDVTNEDGSGQWLEICYDDHDVKLETEDGCTEIKTELSEN